MATESRRIHRIEEGLPISEESHVSLVSAQASLGRAAPGLRDDKVPQVRRSARFPTDLKGMKMELII